MHSFLCRCALRFRKRLWVASPVSVYSMTQENIAPGRQGLDAIHAPMNIPNLGVCFNQMPKCRQRQKATAGVAAISTDKER